MSIPYFTDLFLYNHHFNQKVADLFIEHGDRVPEKAEKLFSHLINAQRIWNGRINGQANNTGVWDIHAAGKCKQIDAENYDIALNILQHKDLSENISYTNTKGQSFTNTIGDILFHVINHSTYHRGQIASELKRNGIEPITTDYIFWKR